MQQREDKKWLQITGILQTHIKIRLRCIICGAADVSDQNNQADPHLALPHQPGLFTAPVVMCFC